MSRAFVKEADGEDYAEDLPERPVSDKPNFVTRRGLRLIDEEVARLRDALAQAQAKGDRQARARHQRDLRYWIARHTSAQVVAPDPAAAVAGFGVLVTFERDDGRQQSLRIVGEDEADPTEGRVSWCAPISQALSGAAIGDLVELPNGDLEVIALAFEAEA